METNEITYNRASGKIYLGGIPYISKIFRDEVEAEEYLSQVGLHLRSSARQSEFLHTSQTQTKQLKSVAPQLKPYPLIIIKPPVIPQYN